MLSVRRVPQELRMVMGVLPPVGMVPGCGGGGCGGGGCGGGGWGLGGLGLQGPGIA